MINWHLEPRSRRLLAKLNRTNVSPITRVFFPADYTVYVGNDDATRRVLEALENRRLRAIERHLGCAFREACADPSRRGEIMRALDGAPDVAVAVAEVLA